MIIFIANKKSEIYDFVNNFSWKLKLLEYTYITIGFCQRNNY